MATYRLELYEDERGDAPVEFRLRSDLRDRVRPGDEPGRFLFRVFCHAHGDRVILLLAAYDKGEDPRRTGRTPKSRSRGRGSGTGSAAEQARVAVDA